MYLPDDRYESVVAFITGLSSASDGHMLDGFNDWVASRLLGHSSPRIWWAIVKDAVPSGSQEPDQAAVELLLELLEQFARHRDSSGRSTRRSSL